ncbi:hypothetical protein Dda_3568 [Drechslerella dactyloides]|uniref:Mid2 domain-containing protein n=1 Tax=Drechslerella dactyloides TaxID=74499 RepID=A0AAD6J2N8_DREDA|nr:hypothetical protein Dda_3568 [Drechslerella dactyloides]
MISLRLWLLSLLFVLPFYTYSLNQRPNEPAEDVFEKRDLEDLKELKAELQKRQDIFTDTDFLASLSSAIDSVSDVLRSITENSDFNIFTQSFGTGFDASLSSLVGSLSSDIFGPTSAVVNAPTTSPGVTPSASTPQVTSPPATSAAPVGTPGQVITDGTRTGTVGDDGTTRFCSASSFLCPAAVSYGCCKDDWTCGLTACTPPGAGGGGASVPPTANIATFVGSTPTYDATFSFTKGGDSAETSSSQPVNQGSKGLSGAAIGGIVGGVVGGIAIIAAGIVWFCLSRRKVKPVPPAEGPKGTEQYTGGPIPPQPQMASYANDPRYQSPPPHSTMSGGFYQPQPNQQPYPNQQGQPGYPQYGQNVQELGGAALPYGQKTDGVTGAAPAAPVPQPPQGISEAPADSAVTSPASPAPPPAQETQAGYGGYKGPSGPVYELS